MLKVKVTSRARLASVRSFLEGKCEIRGNDILRCPNYIDLLRTERAPLCTTGSVLVASRQVHGSGKCHPDSGGLLNALLVISHHVLGTTCES